MQEINLQKIIYTPTSLSEASKLYGKMGKSLIFAGGTYILNNDSKKKPQLPAEVISLINIKELNNIKRTESYLEIGSTTTLSSLMSNKNIGKFVPPILKKAIYVIASPAVRNVATIGGNICAKSKKLSLFPILILLNSKIEIRKNSKSRWIDLKKIKNYSDGINLEKGEILTRIRIPNTNYNKNIYKSTTNNALNSKNFFSFACTIKTNNNVNIDKINFIFNINGEIIRSKRTEDNIIGKNIPLQEKEIDDIYNIFCEDIEKYVNKMISYKKHRIYNFFKVFLDSIEKMGD